MNLDCDIVGGDAHIAPFVIWCNFLRDDVGIVPYKIINIVTDKSQFVTVLKMKMRVYFLKCQIKLLKQGR